MGAGAARSSLQSASAVSSKAQPTVGHQPSPPPALQQYSTMALSQARVLRPAGSSVGSHRLSGARLHPAVSSRRSCIAHVKDITSSAEFEQEVLKADGPVLVDFWAPWCGPCKLVAPLMTWAEKEHQGSLKVVKVEHDANKDLIEKYKVYGLPTLIVFKDGQEVAGSKSEGAVTKAMLVQYIKKHALTAVNV